MIKELHTKAGSFTDYFGYFILIFGWYLLNDRYKMILPQMSEDMYRILEWGLFILAAPIVFAVVNGGINERQNVKDPFERDNIFSHVKTNLWRLFTANFFSLIAYFIVSAIVLIVAGFDSKSPNYNFLVAGIAAVSSVINLFWFSAIVVERKLFDSLFHSLKMLLVNPFALAIGILWGSACLADNLILDLKSTPIPLVITLARFGVFSILRVVATIYLLAIYKTIWGSSPEKIESEQAPMESSMNRSGERLAKVSFGFSFVSFLPILHLVTLILGLLALKRKQRFSLKAGIACWSGGFFTIIYCLLIAGLVIGRPNHSDKPDYEFLAGRNAELEPYVKLLNQGEYQEIQAQLADTSANNANRHWAYDCALALAKYEDHDLDGALHDFYTASQKKPERSEFYFYYGIALLDNNKDDMAVEQFKLALQYDPKLNIAKKYLDLIQSAYRPSPVTSAIMYIIILLVLFALHEYGHAYAAWKLGDDTAKDLGRLTLNPIAHLDLFGSILLPGILILQQSGRVFGWAKPVPVNPANFKNPVRDHALVSFAGPMVNLMVSMVCLVIIGMILLFIRVFWPEAVSLGLSAPSSPVSIVGIPLTYGVSGIIVFLKQLFYTSLVLGFFNLIPIPPLDGAWIFASFLPEGLREFLGRARQFSSMVFLFLALTPIFGYFLSIPINIAWVGLDVLVYVFRFA